VAWHVPLWASRVTSDGQKEPHSSAHKAHAILKEKSYYTISPPSTISEHQQGTGREMKQVKAGLNEAFETRSNFLMQKQDKSVSGDFYDMLDAKKMD
jgi:hypothetical protein